jgi:hypothetical protein
MHTSSLTEAGSGAGPARLRVAGLLEAWLYTFLAALLRRPRAVAAAWHTLTQTLSDDAYFADESEYNDWALEEYPANPYVLLTHNHADCDPRILYVIGPRPNRGMRPAPRRTPVVRPRTARAPPRHPQRGSESNKTPSLRLSASL